VDRVLQVVARAARRRGVPTARRPAGEGLDRVAGLEPAKGEGALLAFRQDSGDAAKRIALENVPPGRTFELVSGPDGAAVGTVTSAELQAGIDVTIPDVKGAQVLLIRPAS